MEFYHVNKDYEYWVNVELEAKPEPKPEPKPQPTKTSKPRYRNFTAIENGETVYYSVRVSEPVRIGGMMV